MKQTAIEKILMKIKSVKLCLMAHPDNELNSEFADRISDLQEIEIELSKQQKVYSEEDMREAFIAGSNSQIEEDDAYGSEYLAYMEEWFKQFKNK